MIIIKWSINTESHYSRKRVQDQFRLVLGKRVEILKKDEAGEPCWRFADGYDDGERLGILEKAITHLTKVLGFTESIDLGVQ